LDRKVLVQGDVQVAFTRARACVCLSERHRRLFKFLLQLIKRLRGRDHPALRTNKVISRFEVYCA
jgi:hypothetical protein